MAIFTDLPCFLTPPTLGHLSRTKRDLFTKLGQCATEAPCQCLLEFQTNPKFDPKWWFCPTRGMAIFADFACFLTSPSKGRISRMNRDLFTKLSQYCYWSPMSMFGWVSNKSKTSPEMVILPHPRYGDFYGFRLLFNSSLKGSYLENKERSLHQTLSLCYWSPMLMFAWVSNKSKIWPKMVILPHPRNGDFYRFALLFNSSHTRPSLENEERSLHQTWSVCYWSPMSMFGWVWRKSKIWPKMVILPHPLYGDFYCFFNSSLTRPSLENEEWSPHKTWSVYYWSPISMFAWVSNKSKISPKMVILPHPRYGEFYGFRLLFNSPHKRPYLDNEERSLHQTWSVCYWTPMSMFAWVSNKSKIWPKMVILPHAVWRFFLISHAF